MEKQNIYQEQTTLIIKNNYINKKLYRKKILK